MRKRTKQGRVPLYLRITINGERIELSTGREILLSQWDSKLQKAKGNTQEANSTNSHLDAVKLSVHRHHSRLVTLGKIVTPQMLKNEYLGISNERKSLKEAIDFFIRQYQEKLSKQLISHVTLEKYENTFFKMQSFLKKQYRVSDIQMNDLDNSFIFDFAHYLITDCNLKNNTAMKRIGMAKSLFIMAKKRGWIKNDVCSEYKCKFTNNEPMRLERDELYRICTKEIQNSRLSEARDCYVFMCFTGFAYIDVSQLTTSNIFTGNDGNQWITKNREKTDNAECVPLLPIPLNLIKRYRNHSKCKQPEKLLPVNSNQKFNAYLKEIATICEINKELTTHTARHTFATTVTLENGVPMETVGKMLGHSSIKSTQRYARVTRRKISENMEELKKKLMENEFGELMKQEDLYSIIKN